MFRLLTSILLGCAPLLMSTPEATAQTSARSIREVAKRTESRRFAANNAAIERFTVGERIVYQIKYSNASFSDFSALFKNGSPTENAPSSALTYTVESSVEGKLEISVLKKNSGGTIVAYSLPDARVRLRVNNQDVADHAETIQASLSRYVFAEVSPEGKITSVQFDSASNNLSQSFARTLLALTQFVVPRVLSPRAQMPNEWETQEDDPAGIFIARYQVVPDSSDASTGNSQTALKTYRKTKMRYLPPDSKKKPGELQVSQTIKPQGSLMARFDVRRGQLISLGGSESQSVIIAGRTIAQNGTSVRIDYLNKVVIGLGELTALRGSSAAREKIAIAVPLSAAESEEAGETSIHRAELGGATAESLLADLAQIEASAEERKDKTALYLKFKALVYLRPESCTRIGEILAAAEADSATLLTLSGALSAVGHTQAQQALVAVIRARPTDWRILSTLIPALGSVGAPTKESEAVLRGLAFNSANTDIASTARLALGVMARKLADRSPDRAAKIVSRIIKNFEGASAEKTAREMLLVLGNTGSTLALPTVARFVAHRDSSLRAAAVSALRWIDASRADALLIKALSSDSDAAVRLEAAVALGFRPVNVAGFNAQKRVFARDTEVKVRSEILRNLWKVRADYPEVRQLVKQSAAQDTAKEIRELASSIINANPEEF